MAQVVANRTFNVLPIVEGVYDMGNLAAITRSSDGAANCIGACALPTSLSSSNQCGHHVLHNNTPSQKEHADTLKSRLCCPAALGMGAMHIINSG